MDIQVELAADEFMVSFDPERVSPDAMLEAIRSNTGFTPTVVRSRVEHLQEPSVPELHALVQAAIDKAAASNKGVYIDFHATWCGACRILEQTTLAAPAVRKVLTAGYVFLKIDTDEYPEIAKQFDVVGLPTMVALNQAGEVVFRHVGLISAEVLLRQLDAVNQEQSEL